MGPREGCKGKENTKVLDKPTVSAEGHSKELKTVNTIDIHVQGTSTNNDAKYPGRANELACLLIDWQRTGSVRRILRDVFGQHLDLSLVDDAAQQGWQDTLDQINAGIHADPGKLGLNIIQAYGKMVSDLSKNPTDTWYSRRYSNNNPKVYPQPYLNSLSNIEREIIDLRSKGQSYKEIASTINRTVDYVGSRLYQIKRAYIESTTDKLDVSYTPQEERRVQEHFKSYDRMGYLYRLTWKDGYRGREIAKLLDIPVPLYRRYKYEIRKYLGLPLAPRTKRST